MGEACPIRTIGQLAEAGGVGVQTVRYYERRRLLLPTSRLPSGYRLYGAEALQRLRFIRNAQALGFTLREIEGLLNLRVSSAARCDEVQQAAQAKLVTVEAKIRDLEALARVLRTFIRSCRAGRPTEHCPILASLESPTLESNSKSNGGKFKKSNGGRGGKGRAKENQRRYESGG
ncbi:heavy metal-responsive transcriptional regulator [Candidatus Nitrospira inopinata]|jgi:MerR family mercuric resistance operon transcriptional regulator/MerR family gold-responsive transcriptional activator of gol and ges genes|uniref:Mercuric resistance operon regulatory protein (Modular protein) n=1 Tax=Candidatus Nitrospira inopinata TaxID=1715989 RepID=A0A0S4KNK3_9BACT|nr:heavy metal-responsive transcriptional regulator [Candidatus Nitrospira inopinata]CUQ66035.1 Mercuric resistance operon regulatory protein (modular protein) [Candidatus Nitrospira inopinata]